MNRENKEIIPSGFTILSTQYQIKVEEKKKRKENTFKLKRENKLGTSQESHYHSASGQTGVENKIKPKLTITKASKGN